VAGCCALSLIVAWLAGVFRRGSINGPLRLPPEKSTGSLWLAAVAGISGMFLAQSLYVIVTVPNVSAATQPIEFNPHQTAMISLVATGGALATLLLAHLLVDPSMPMQLGLRVHGALRGVFAGWSDRALPSRSCLQRRQPCRSYGDYPSAGRGARAAQSLR